MSEPGATACGASDIEQPVKLALTFWGAYIATPNNIRQAARTRYTFLFVNDHIRPQSNSICLLNHVGCVIQPVMLTEKRYLAYWLDKLEPAVGVTLTGAIVTTWFVLGR